MDRSAVAHINATQRLMSLDANIQRNAIRQLERSGENGARALSQRLGVPGADAAGELRAAKALERMGEVGAAALASRLRDPGNAWKTAAEALGRMEVAIVTPHAAGLSAELEHGDEMVRKRAAEVLGHIGPAGHAHADELASRLGDRHAWVRWNAMKALQTMGEVGATALARRLGDNDAIVWRTAVQALEKMGQVGQVALASTFQQGQDSDAWVRSSEALRRIGPTPLPKTRVAVSQLLTHDTEEREKAVAALGRLGPLAAPYGNALGKCLEDGPTSWVRKRAVEALCQTGDVGAQVMSGWLGHTDPWVRRRAAEGLGMMGGSVLAPHKPAMERQLADHNPWVRWRAQEVLQRVAPSEEPQLELRT
eukprot:TRINITY_DN9031_c0_g1_i1.p1 TRINITY_DN9031_c0_g1~~TRINITY_DN9031_c0_g1_i1.p1  ORF type:complete len:366 (+),score=46.02 TRINITY_DN9031_c0_g1_i1:274-1371(+)